MFRAFEQTIFLFFLPTSILLGVLSFYYVDMNIKHMNSTYIHRTIYKCSGRVIDGRAVRFNNLFITCEESKRSQRFIDASWRRIYILSWNEGRFQSGCFTSPRNVGYNSQGVESWGGERITMNHGLLGKKNLGSKAPLEKQIF